MVEIQFSAEISRYHLLPSDENPYYDSPTFFSLCSALVSAGVDKDCHLFFEAFAPFLVADWDRLVSIFPKGHYERLAYVLYLILKSTKESLLSFAEIDAATIKSFYAANSELGSSAVYAFAAMVLPIYKCEPLQKSSLQSQKSSLQKMISQL